MPAPAIILELVERFKEQRDSYKSGNYNETQLRLEFLDPFFKALGWDVANEQSYAAAGHVERRRNFSNFTRNISCVTQ
jgi:hypothetical protein